MADDLVKGTKEPMPSSEGTKSQPTQSVTTDKAVTPQTDDLILPQDTSERTKEQFEKLKAKLAEKDKQLEEERKKKAAVEPKPETNYGSSVLDLTPQQPVQQFVQSAAPVYPQQFYGYPAQPPQTPYLNPQQREGIRQGFIDENGNIDIQAFNSALSRANAQAQQAFQAAQQAEARARKSEADLARFEENQQAKVLHEKFPELDPIKKETFDANFFQLVRSRIRDDMIQGKSTKDIDYAARVAAEVKLTYRSPQDKQEEAKKETETIEKYKQSQEARNQGPFETGKGESRSVEDYKSLRKRTRAGDPKAFDERLNEVLNRKE